MNKINMFKFVDILKRNGYGKTDIIIIQDALILSLEPITRPQAPQPEDYDDEDDD